MRYTVVWKPEAERHLAQLWLDAPTRNDIAIAANWIDRALERNPQQQGESREHERRILLVPPLGVVFNVIPEDRVVRVLTVWLLPERFLDK